MTLQFETAFDFFVDIYGFPSWEDNLKPGQSKEKIIAIWEKELFGYSCQQIKEACMRVVKYKKSMTFPTISLLMTELYNEKKEAAEEERRKKILEDAENRRRAEEEKRLAEEAEKKRKQETEEKRYLHWVWKCGVVIDGEKITLGTYSVASWRLIDAMRRYDEDKYRQMSWDELVNEAEKNGWATRIIEFCEKVVRERK